MNDDWIQNFRMTKETFCTSVMIEKMDTRMRKAIPVEKRVAITLWHLATNADYRTIGPFGVSKGAVCVIIKQVYSATTKTLTSEFQMINDSLHDDGMESFPVEE